MSAVTRQHVIRLLLDGVSRSDSQNRAGAVKAGDVFSSPVANQQASAQKEKVVACPGIDETPKVFRASETAVDSLRIYCNEYDRGAIVKLAIDHSRPAIAKYIIKKYHGIYQLLDGNGDKPYQTHKFTTLAAATGQAIRECERIRDHLTGGGSVRSEG